MNKQTNSLFCQLKFDFKATKKILLNLSINQPYYNAKQILAFYISFIQLKTNNMLKSKLNLLCGALLIAVQTVSQVAWQNQTSGTTNDLHDVQFIDSQTGWVVGENGTILKTTNGGTSWSSQTSGLSQDLYAVFFINASTGWACGDAGKILKTTDGGSTWSPQSLGITTSGVLHDVFFTSLNVGFIAGTFGVYKTTDGGSSWSLSHTSNSSAINSVYFKDAMNGYSCGLNGKIRKTSDGGASWTQVNASSSDDYYDVFVGGNKTFVVGFEGEVLSSSDNGSTWNSYPVPSSLYAIYFIDNNNGWFCGSSGKTYYTNNGGVSWTQASTGYSSSMRDIFFLDQNTGWAVGYSGRILKYTGISTTRIENTNFEFEISPNPVNDLLLIRTEAIHINRSYSIVNALGMEVLTGVLQDQANEIQLSHLPSGIYFLSINGAAENRIKFIKN